MLSYFSIIVCACALLHLFNTVDAGPWASPAQEQLDEINDVEIYKAVVSSIEKWKSRKLQKQLNKREKRETPSVCYANLGCFEAQGPFAYLEMVPGPPEDVGTKFFLYPSHRSRRNGFTQIEVSFSNISDAFKWGQQGFDQEIPTKVLIHGFGSDCSHIWVYELRSALMAVEEMNIICVDWSKGAELPNYVKAVVNTRLVGKQVSKLLNGLMENSGLLAKNVHLIGFSLGAHVAGFTGSDLGNLSRITGLDPAGPLFESQDPRARLDQSDADFVDVIHSNGENLILGGLGSWQPLGHVDFYPNGGRMQKGCSNIFLGAVSDIIWSSAIEGRSLCNHRRAYKFFTDSVSPRCHFPAFPCHSYDNFVEGNCFPCTDERSCGNMGYYADRWKGRGQLYLITRDEEPFCAYQYKINIKSSSSETPIVSYGKIQVMLLGDSPLNETFVMTRKDDEEMVLGNEISRIFVPHPILADPTQIEILYTAYSGWLSSGLTHWKIDKLSLSDSYGKISSICQKSLILESGKPVVLPLHPGDCQLPVEKESGNYTTPDEQPKENVTNSEKFEERVNKLSLSDAMLIFNLPWLQGASDKDNVVVDEHETSRALNTKFTEDSYFNGTNSTTLPEIVEPVLKPQSRKNARAHHYAEEKSEISEPILRSTTTKIFAPNKIDNNKELTYDFYDSSKDEWGSIVNVNSEKKENAWKGEHFKDVPYEDEAQKPPTEFDGFNSIIMTVQFLPMKLAKMFEQAEKYAKETILPFVSAHTPKIIRDFIAPEPPIMYLPLHFDDTTEISKLQAVVTNKSDIHTPLTTTPSLSTVKSTPYTHIQKIFKRQEFNITPLNSEKTQDAQASGIKPITIKGINDLEKSKSFPTDEVDTNLMKSANANTSQQIYIDLPVFDKNYQQPKYIPIIPETNKENGSN